MATEPQTDAREERGSSLQPWQGGVIGGLVGSFGFGLIMAFVIPDPVLEVAIPNLYLIEATPDDPAPIIGWIIHMSHGAILGVAFAAILQLDGVRDIASDTVRTAGLGLVYGVIVWLVFAVIVMPIWLDAVGFGGAPPLPNISELSLLGHALYGVLLGIVYDMVVAEY